MFPYYILFLDPDGVPYITGPWSETDIDVEFRLRERTKEKGTLIKLEITGGFHGKIPFIDVGVLTWRWTGEPEDDSRGT